MARNRPEIIWIIKQRPKREPKFHQVERLGGVGRSIMALFTGRARGWDFRPGLITCNEGVK